MNIPHFRFDYPVLDLDELKSQCITPDEVENVFYDVDTFYDDFEHTEEFEYMIGFSLKSKFVAFTFTLVETETVRFVQIYLPHEREIRFRYYNIWF